MRITVPELSLVVLIGPSGSGKTAFAKKHFRATEIISSDFCRRLVSDDENNQKATADAFDVMKLVVAKRLSRGLLTVIDATNLRPDVRSPLIELAREHDVPLAAIVFDVPEKICHERNRGRRGRNVAIQVIRNQIWQMRHSLHHLDREGFRRVYCLGFDKETRHCDGIIDHVKRVERQRLWNNRNSDNGEFDTADDVRSLTDGDNPVFGKRIAGRTYKPRPGAYAIIRDESGRIAVIQLPGGAFLPGGGCDPGETNEQTLVREIREEIGHAIAIGKFIGRATQLVGSPERGLFEKDGSYFEGVLGERICEPTEVDHVLLWLTPQDAVAALKHEAQRWIVRRATRPVPTSQTGHAEETPPLGA